MKAFLAADYGALKQNVDPVVDTVSRTGAVEVGAGLYIGQFGVNRPSGAEQVGSVLIDGRLVRLEPRRLVIVDGERETAFDLAPLDVAFDTARQAPLSIPSADGRSTLIVNAARVRKTGGAITVERISGSAVVAGP